MNRILLSAVAGLAAFGMAAANAAVLNFGAEAEIGGERGVANLTTIGPTASLDFAITLQSAVGGVTNQGFAYFDGPGGGEPTAGLGVCAEVDANMQCVPSSDDNITFGEAVRIVFTGAENGIFDVRQISFLGEGHVDYNGNALNTLLIGVNGGSALTRYTFAGAIEAAIAGAFLGIASIEFYFDDDSWAGFTIDANGLDANAEQYYIGMISDVPVPGALPLLLSGLAGLGFARRKKKTA